jgi:hypothetical protein
MINPRTKGDHGMKKIMFALATISAAVVLSLSSSAVASTTPPQAPTA